MPCLDSPWSSHDLPHHPFSIFPKNPFSPCHFLIPYLNFNIITKNVINSLPLVTAYNQLPMFSYEEFGFSHFDHIQPQPCLKELNHPIFSHQSEQPSKNKKNSWLVPPKKIQKQFWKQHQNMLYLQFLELHESEYYQCSTLGTKSHMNVKMSSFVKSRTVKQCRSHHQKMIKKHRSIEEIIIQLRSQFKKRQNSNQGLSHNKLTFQLDISLQENCQFYDLLSPEPISHSFVDLNAFIQ